MIGVKQKQTTSTKELPEMRVDPQTVEAMGVINYDPNIDLLEVNVNNEQTHQTSHNYTGVQKNDPDVELSRANKLTK